MRRCIRTILFSISLFMFLAGCQGGGQDSSAPAIERYIRALVSKDMNQVINASCADWEPSARVDLDSFAAVDISLQDLRCQEDGKEGTSILVACSGKIIANYGNEVQEIDLADHKYLAVQDGNEWRMCGYR